MDTLLQDIHFAARQLLRRPTFALIAIATLALGIGATAGLFSVISSVLLAPLPYGTSDRVVVLWNSIGDEPKMPLSGPEYFDYREQLRSLEDLAAYRKTEVNLFGAADPERVATATVTSNLFSVLQRQPVLGRSFSADEQREAASSTVLLSDELWRRRFGADPAVLGRSVEVDGVQATIVGVLPPGFGLPEDFTAQRPTELWMPLSLSAEAPGERGRRSLRAIGRLQPTSSLEQANQEVRSLAARWQAEGLTTVDEFSASLVSAADEVTGDVRASLLLLFGAVGLVLLIASANVANLLMTRTDERRREFAVRTALGAGRRRLMRHLIAESLLLALAGGALGLLIASAGVGALTRLGMHQIPRLDAVSIDGGVLAFTAATVVLITILIGLVPALRTGRFDIASPLKDAGRGSTASRESQQVRHALVIAEVAISVMLLIAAGLLLRSMTEMNRIALGFQPEGVLTAQVTLPISDYSTSEEMIRFYQGARERIEQIPGVVSAGAIAALPLAQPIGDWGIDIEGRERGPGERFFGYLQIATPGYLETMRLGQQEGRPLEDSDRIGSSPVVVINRTMADQISPTGEALGRRIRLRGFEEDWFTIIGIVSDSRHNEIVDVAQPEMFFPHAQLPVALGGTVAAMTITVRTSGAPTAMAGAVRSAIRELDPRLPLAAVRPMTDVVADALARPRFTTSLLTLFAATALLLGLIGIYGVVSNAVARRVPEIGIRMALGAGSARILRMTIRQAMVLVAVGLAIGLGAALVASRLLTGLLYGVSVTDPLIWTAAPLTLAAVALLASWIPARRAAGVDPLTALRSG